MLINYQEVFIGFLEQLNTLLKKAQSHCRTEQELLNARLFDDMFAFNVQVKIATNFALRACYPLSGKEYNELDADLDSFDGLRSHIRHVINCISALEQPDIQQLQQTVRDSAGLTEIQLPGTEYVTRFALPNFFFHLSMAYATAKSFGVPVSKGDFDGIHEYPQGFSWETTNSPCDDADK